MLVDLLKKQIIILRSLRLIQDKIPSITSLVTTVVLNALENKMLNVSNLVKKWIMMQKYFTLRLSILPHLIIIILRMKYLSKDKRKRVS